MDATWITAMRTGAATAVAAKYLAAPGAHRVGIIGAGVQGRGNLLALAAVLTDLRTVCVYDIRAEAAERCAREMAAITGRQVRAVATAREAVEGAHIIVTATTMFKELAFLDPAILFDADLFAVDDLAQVQAFQVMGGFPRGMPPVAAELGEIVAGVKSGRSRPDQVVVAMNVGIASEDVAVGRRVYERAVARGIGRWLPLWENG